MDPATTHMFSRENLIGPEPTDSLVHRYSAELQVSAQTPPAILILSADDSLVKPDNSLLYFKALRAMDVPAEMHIYPTGGHGWGCTTTSLTANNGGPNLKTGLTSYK